MDKKGIFAIVLALAAVVWFQFDYTKKAREYDTYVKAKQAEDAKVAQAKADEAAKAAKATAANPNTPVESTTAGATPATPATPAVSEKIEKIKAGEAEYEFTNYGGGIAKAVLEKHLVDKKNNKNVVLNEFGSVPIGAIAFTAGADTNLPYEVKRDDANRKVSFERVDAQQLAITKTFTLPKTTFANKDEELKDAYRLGFDVSFTNRSDKPINVPTYWVHNGSAAPLHETDPVQYIGLNYFRGSSNKFINLTYFREGRVFGLFGHDARPIYQESTEDLRWGTVGNQYFTTLISPIVDEKLLTDQQKAMRGNGVWARHFDVPIEKWTASGRARVTSKPLDGVDGAFAMAGFTLKPGETVTRQFSILAGPSEYGRLRKLDNYETEILDFGMFGWISKGLLWALNTLRSFLGSYWAAIMVLTICIRSAMWPLQNRATQTSKKMAALSPKLKDLQERYKDDPMRMQQETSKLWREYGVNPIGGCLPMFAQIPIFFGFYSMLNRAVELRNNGFLWVQDLSQPDTITRIAGVPINILPIVMAATMLTQMRLSPKTGDPAQQRIMMFMPLIFIAMCYNYAAALALYWSVQNIFSIVQLYVTRDRNPVTVERIAPTPGRKSKR